MYRKPNDLPFRSELISTWSPRIFHELASPISNASYPRNVLSQLTIKYLQQIHHFNRISDQSFLQTQKLFSQMNILKVLDIRHSFLLLINLLDKHQFARRKWCPGLVLNLTKIFFNRWLQKVDQLQTYYRIGDTHQSLYSIQLELTLRLAWL